MVFVRCTYTEDVGIRVERFATRIADAAKGAAPPTTQTARSPSRGVGTRVVKSRARLSVCRERRFLFFAFVGDLRAERSAHGRAPTPPQEACRSATATPSASTR